MKKILIAITLLAGCAVGAGLLTAAPPTGTLPGDNETRLRERTILISLPALFAELERPPVRFPHERHARELEPEGCTVCHPVTGNHTLQFTYPKETGAETRSSLTEAFHDSCIGCHETRAATGRSSGPVTCGECHRIPEEQAQASYEPVLPEYYDVLRDTYHGQCRACHRRPEKTAADAGALDWKDFYVRVAAKEETAWPEVFFDYLLHDRHEIALQNDCGQCHYLDPVRNEELQREGKEPTCRDWLHESDPAGSVREERVAHALCINCHLERAQRGDEAGPVYCSQCHARPVPAAAALRAAPRQECDQNAHILIEVEQDARMPAVGFRHTRHQEHTRGCQQCHHDTLRSCRECHTPAGSEEGDFITLAEAFHAPESSWSCVGCHNREKNRPDCAGCHQLFNAELAETGCTTCHNGALRSDDPDPAHPAAGILLPADVDKELKIDVLADEYRESPFPHEQIVAALIARADNSTLARVFHRDDTTLCQGCHHLGPVEPQQRPPACRTCHTARREPLRTVPTLLGAYHRQCLGCHIRMQLPEAETPRSCDGCHEEAPGAQP